MYRVRKLARKSAPPDSRSGGRRARMSEFAQAVRRQMRRRQEFTKAQINAVKQLCRDAATEVGSLTTVEGVMRGHCLCIGVSLSQAGYTPSVAEFLRVATALQLSRTLNERAIAPFVVALWAGIPASMDNSPRMLLARDGTPTSVPPTDGLEREAAVDLVMRSLIESGFSAQVRRLLTESWHPNPVFWKLRQITRMLTNPDLIVLPTESQSKTQPNSSAQAAHTYRVSLARLLEGYPVLSLVHPPVGSTADTDAAAAVAFAGEVVPFPSVSVTMVEPKVERWLERYGIRPEEVMDPAVDVSRLVRRVTPVDPAGAVSQAREKVLARVFSTEHSVRETGMNLDQQLDRLAVQLDQQFDRLKTAAVRAGNELEVNARSHLKKARAFLRPDGMAQSDALAMLHFLSLYGSDYWYRVRESLEIGDARHHLMYMAGEMNLLEV